MAIWIPEQDTLFLIATVSPSSCTRPRSRQNLILGVNVLANLTTVQHRTNQKTRIRQNRSSQLSVLEFLRYSIFFRMKPCPEIVQYILRLGWTRFGSSFRGYRSATLQE